MPDRTRDLRKDRVGAALPFTAVLDVATYVPRLALPSARVRADILFTPTR